MVSYNQKHNEANREENRDRGDRNWSLNGGVEDPTNHPEIQEAEDISWIHPLGREMSTEDWRDASLKCMGVLMEGSTLEEMNEKGEALWGDSLLILLNAQ